MNMHRHLTLTLWVLVSTLILGCETTPKSTPSAPEVPVGPPKSAPPPPAQAAPRPMPMPMPAPPAPVSEKVSLTAEAYFPPSRAVLDAAGKAQLSQLVSKLRGMRLEVIIAVGHADVTERATDAAAQALSVARAEAVKAHLISLGVEANRVYAEGKGRLQPVDRGRSASALAKNRRVDIETVGARARDASATETPKPPKGHVPVLFGTIRAKTGKNDPADYFGSDEAQADFDKRLTLGQVTVRVPPNRVRGEIKEPGFFAVTLARISSNPLASALGVSTVQAADLKTDFSFVGPIEEFTDSAFADVLKKSMTSSKSKSALVYVHGFANSFKDAAFRTAQFAYDLADESYDVVPVLFSWPSDANKVNYIAATDRTWSAGKQLALFLDKLSATTGAGVVHIVAHSKGAQVLGVALDELKANALLALSKDGTALVPRFNQIVLAAPDILASDFASLVLPAIATQHHVTNYVSSNDAALRTSKKINAGARAGDSGNTAIVIKGVETIDVTAVNYRAGGHSSFADSPRVIADIRQQLSGVQPETRRLQRVTRRDQGYWLLKE